MSEAELKLKRRELGIVIFRTFTKELIMNSGPVSIAKLQTIVEKDRELPHHKAPRTEVNIQRIQQERKQRFQEKLQEKRLRQEILKREQSRLLIQQRRNQSFEKLKLNVPETKLPERFNYLRPVPVEAQVDLGKIDILIQDPNVEAIECSGESEEVIVRGMMGEQRTEIKLTKKEIDLVINKFSEWTKIPVSEGIYKVVYGKLILLAVISEVVGSKFLIKKMRKPQAGLAPNAPMPNFPPPKPLPNPHKK